MFNFFKTKPLQSTDLFIETKNYANTMSILIDTYVNKILSIDSIQNRRFDSTQIKIFLTSYAIAVNSFIFPSFKDKSNGKILMSNFNDKLGDFIETEGQANSLSKMTFYFRDEIISKSNEIKDIALALYCDIDKIDIDSEEAIWVKNFINGVHNNLNNFESIAKNNNFI